MSVNFFFTEINHNNHNNSAAMTSIQQVCGVRFIDINCFIAFQIFSAVDYASIPLCNRYAASASSISIVLLLFRFFLLSTAPPFPCATGTQCPLHRYQLFYCFSDFFLLSTTPPFPAQLFICDHDKLSAYLSNIVRIYLPIFHPSSSCLIKDNNYLLHLRPQAAPILYRTWDYSRTKTHLMRVVMMTTAMEPFRYLQFVRLLNDFSSKFIF